MASTPESRGRGRTLHSFFNVAEQAIKPGGGREPSANKDEALGALLAKSVLVLDLVAGELEQIAAMRRDHLAVGVLGDEGPFEGAAVAGDKNLQVLKLSV